MITKQELDAANREAEQAHDNAERFRTPVKFTQEEWNQALENVIKLQADLDASQNNLANAEQECADLKAKLEKVESETQERIVVFRKYEAELTEATHKLAHVEATAKRRLELLRMCEWSAGPAGRPQCPMCQAYEHGLKYVGHAPTCLLAAELKPTP